MNLAALPAPLNCPLASGSALEVHGFCAAERDLTRPLVAVQGGNPHVIDSFHSAQARWVPLLGHPGACTHHPHYHIANNSFLYFMLAAKEGHRGVYYS